MAGDTYPLDLEKRLEVKPEIIVFEDLEAVSTDDDDDTALEDEDEEGWVE